MNTRKWEHNKTRKRSIRPLLNKLETSVEVWQQIDSLAFIEMTQNSKRKKLERAH